MSVEYAAVSAVGWPPARQSGPRMDAAGDFTGKVVLDGLSPDTAYVYWVRFTATGEAVVSEAAQFRTAPPDDAVRPLGLVWWGDLAGQGYCRDPERGYAIFGQMARLAPDLAIADGDSVYVDGACPPASGLPDQPRNALSRDPETAVFQLAPATDPRWRSEAEVLAAFRPGSSSTSSWPARPARSRCPPPLSRAFGPIELYARGRRADPARPSFLNFGHLRIAADGLLTVEIRDAEGAVVPDDRGRPGALTLIPAR